MRWSRDGGSLYWLTNRDSEFLRLARYDLAFGEERLRPPENRGKRQREIHHQSVHVPPLEKPAAPKPRTRRRRACLAVARSAEAGILPERVVRVDEGLLTIEA